MNNDKDIESTDGVAAPAGDETRDATDTDVPPVEESADTTPSDESPSWRSQPRRQRNSRRVGVVWLGWRCYSPWSA